MDSDNNGWQKFKWIFILLLGEFLWQCSVKYFSEIDDFLSILQPSILAAMSDYVHVSWLQLTIKGLIIFLEQCCLPAIYADEHGFNFTGLNKDNNIFISFVAVCNLSQLARCQMSC